MSSITAEMIKELRERTGVGMGKCKEALEQAGGDMDKAIEWLRKAGMASSVKKQGRETKEGSIGIGESPKAFAFVEVNSETDFVAQNDLFKNFLAEVVQIAAETHAHTVEALMAHKSKSDPSLTLDELRNLAIQRLGENIQVKRVALIPKHSDISIGVYSHMNGKIVTAVEMTGGAGHEVLARDVAMHIAAEAPEYRVPADVPAEIREREEEIAKSQLKGKPENMIDKIVKGKLETFYAQVCLLCQKYVKENSLTIEQLLEKESKAAGRHFGIKSFLRWKVGE